MQHSFLHMNITINAAAVWHVHISSIPLVLLLEDFISWSSVHEVFLCTGLRQDVRWLHYKKFKEQHLGGREF